MQRSFVVTLSDRVMQDKFAQLGKELDDDETFKDIYRFAFNFCLETVSSLQVIMTHLHVISFTIYPTKEQQRSIGLDIAVAMMGLLIPDGKYPLAKDYRRFLEDQTTFKVMLCVRRLASQYYSFSYVLTNPPSRLSTKTNGFKHWNSSRLLMMWDHTI